MRPPIIQPKVPEKQVDLEDIERWIARLSRHIKLRREAERLGLLAGRSDVSLPKTTGEA